MSKTIDLTGKRIGEWLVVKRGKEKGHLAFWECLCSCGTLKDVLVYNLVNGTSKSCGCLRKASPLKHGHCKNKGRTPEHSAWKAIKARCNNPKDKRYPYYGGRGISVCKSWAVSFERFLNDMGLKPGKGYEIDRIDVNGDYEPSNCRWITREQGSRNKRKHRDNKSTYKGVYLNCNKYQATIAVNHKTMYLGSYDNPITAAKAYDDAAEKYHGEFAATNKSLGLL